MLQLGFWEPILTEGNEQSIKILGMGCQLTGLFLIETAVP